MEKFNNYPKVEQEQPANQELELELTYLAKEIPKEIEGIQPTRIIDVYVPDTPEHSHLRLRQKGDKYEITKKEPVKDGDASEQTEQTIPLTEEEFLSLSANSQKRVAKDRYNVEIDGAPAEVDVFLDDLSGFVLIDFEFATIEDKTNFIPPAVVLAEVTQEDFVAGGLLAGKKYEDISSELSQFDYNKL